MSVVSDAWADLPDLFAQLGIDRYFEGFAISDVVGTRKPDPRMYATGSDLLGLTPDAFLFVDGDPALVAAAVALGYHGIALIRDGTPSQEVTSIASLAELLKTPLWTEQQ